MRGYVEKKTLEAALNAGAAADSERRRRTWAKAICILHDAPDADVVPVVHAQWGEYESFPIAPSMNGYPCGNCGMHFSASAVPILNYCPNCGAKMDGGQP